MRPDTVAILAGICAAIHVGKLPPALPVLRDAFGMTLVEAGLLLSLVQFAAMTAGIVVGLAADCFGLRRSMLAGLAILAVASALGGFAREAWELMILRAIEGFGVSGDRPAGASTPAFDGAARAPAAEARCVGRIHAGRHRARASVRAVGDGASSVGAGWWWSLAALTARHRVHGQRPPCRADVRA